METEKGHAAHAEHYWERAERAADQLRAMLLALASAGIAASFAAKQDAGSAWKLAAVFFMVALVPLVVSWFLVKHRALKNAQALEGGRKPKALHWYSPTGSTLWDGAGAILIGAGALSLALSVWFGR